MCDDGPLPLPGSTIASTANLRVVADEDLDLCLGTFVDWQSSLDLMSTLFERTPPDQIDVFVTSAPSLLCSENNIGCAKFGPRPMVAVARQYAVAHEVAHVFEESMVSGRMIPAFEEGFAEMFSGRGGVLPRSPTVGVVNALSASEVDYSHARHFTRWLLSEIGPQDLLALYSSSESSDSGPLRVARIEDSLGLPWREVQRLFWQGAPLYDPGEKVCDFVDGSVPSKGTLVLTVPFECGSEQTRGPHIANEMIQGRYSRKQVIEVNEPGRYWLETTPGLVSLVPCDVRNDPYDAAIWGLLDQPIYTVAALTSFRRAWRLDLLAGRYLATVMSEEGSAEPARVAIHVDRPLSAVLSPVVLE